MSEEPPPRLLGRRREKTALAELLATVRAGGGGVILLRGDAGIGKTSLLQYALARASGFRTLRVSGAESEMELAYAGLHQLCSPLLSRLERLPGPQQRALQVALGLAEGEPPDRLIVGLAVLTLLSEVSSERPTVCLIDDAQWIDAESLQALAFVARRLIADPIAMIFAACERREDGLLADLPELTVGGLDDVDARAVLSASVPGPIDEQVRTNIIAEAGGNPLALKELHRVLTPADLAGGFGLAEANHLTLRMQHGFAQRVNALDPQTRVILLIAAADPTGDPRWLTSAAARLGIEQDAVQSVEEVTDLVSIGTRVRFVHPLVRSAVYRSAPQSERRRVHQALAEVADGSAAAEHRAWHRAHAASLPDEEVAEELERSAEHARARGGVAAAAAFLEFAVDLTPDPERRAVRTLSAAQAKLDAGAPESAAKMLLGARHATADELLSAKLDLLRAQSACPSGRGGDMTRLLLATAKRLDDLDTELARDTYFEAITAALLAGRLARGPDVTALAVAGAARHAPPPPTPPRVVDVLLNGLVARVTECYATGVPILKAGIAEFLRQDRSGEVDIRWYDMATRIALDLFDHEAFEYLTSRQLHLLRDAGVLSQLPAGLGARAAADVFAGRFTDAEAHLSEAEAIATAIGGPLLRRIDPLLAAYRGQEQQCEEMVRETVDGGAAHHGQGFSIAAGLLATAVLHNALGRYADALTTSQAAYSYDDLAIDGHAMAEAVEAASRCGNVAAAAEALELLVERTDASGTETAAGLAARSRALVHDGPLAEAEYLRAIDHLEGSPAVVYLARTHLVYGEWLRRQGRRVDARVSLRTAHEMFVQMGADGFAERASRELRATGETVRKRAGEPDSELTAQEGHITRLAVEGRTNSEIATQLFISPRTVEWHMSKIFAKLGVTSRKELRKQALLGD